MTVNFKNNDFVFDLNGGAQHHFGRCYISDFEKTFKILKILKEYGILRLDDFPLVFPTSRAENWREHLIEMWRTGLNIGIIPYGAGEYGFAYLGEGDVKDMEIVKNLVVTNRENYPYTLFFLKKLKKYPSGITEKELADIFFTKNKRGEVKDGAVDQIHPTMDDLTRWNYIEGKQRRTITNNGLKILNKFKNYSLNFICYNMDLDNDNFKARILWSILRTIEKIVDLPRYPLIKSDPPYKIKISEIIDKYNSKGVGVNKGLLSEKEIIKLLKDLKVDHNYDEKAKCIQINERIFFSITPQGYIKAGLSFMDNIGKYASITYENVILNEKKLENEFWVLTDDNDYKKEDFPNGSSILNFKEWLKLKDNLSELHPKAIILPPSWSPAILEASCGHIHSFVNNGGIIIIHGPQGGRTGTNKQFYNWLPEDFERLNFLESSGMWTFDKNRLPIVSVAPIFCNSFNPSNIGNNPSSQFVAKYGNGYFIFEGKLPSPVVYNDIENKYKIKNIKLSNFTNTPSWKWKRIAQLYRDKDILSEGNIYPIVGDEILQKQIGFNLSETFSYSWSGSGYVGRYVDLFTVYPSITLWEIDSIKGKNGILKGIAGDSIAIDITHAEKTRGYCIQAEEQYSSLIEIIKKMNLNEIEKFKIKVTENIEKLETHENFQMREIFEKYLGAFLSLHIKFNVKDFVNFIENSNASIQNKPVISLLGTSYGFPEGSKMSAREISKRDKYSLWTYRDLYEFLVRTDNMKTEEKMNKLLSILNQRKGPVYFEIAKL